MNQNYLLLGPEKGKKKEFLESMYKQIVQQSGEKPEFYKYYAFDLNAGDLVSMVSNGSLFCSKLFVILENCEQLNASEATVLGDYLKNPSPDCYIFFISEENSQSKISSKLTGNLDKEHIQIFWEMFENDKKSWIISFFKKNQLMVSSDAVDMILDLVENNIEDIRQQCEKLSLFFMNAGEITEENIEQYLFHSKEENVFTFFDRLAIKDLEGSMDVLNKIRFSGDDNYVQLIAGLTWQFKKLSAYIQMLSNRYSPDDIFKILAVKAKSTQRIYKAASTKFNKEQIKNVLIRLEDTDLLMRSTRTEVQPLIMDLLVYTITVQGVIPEVISNLAVPYGQSW